MPKVCKVKALQKLTAICPKKKFQEHDINAQKEVCLKIDTLNLPKKYARKLAR